MVLRFFILVLFCLCLPAKNTGHGSAAGIAVQAEQDKGAKQEFCSNSPVDEVHAILVANPKLAEYKKPVYRFVKNHRKYCSASLLPGTGIPASHTAVMVPGGTFRAEQVEIPLLLRNLRI